MTRSKINQIVREARHHIVLGSYTEYYHSRWQWDVFHAEWLRAARLSLRYRRYREYCEEVLPGWKTVEVHYFADNSVQAEQVCKCGQHRRWTWVKPPGGDRCF